MKTYLLFLLSEEQLTEFRYFIEAEDFFKAVGEAYSYLLAKQRTSTETFRIVSIEEQSDK